MRCYLPAIMGGAICRQRKGKLFWRTTAWLFTHQKSTIDGYVEHFDWEENTRRPLGRRQF